MFEASTLLQQGSSVRKGCQASIWSGHTGALRLSVFALTFALTLFIRVRGIGTRFWMLWDQIRDWSIALGPFSDLPLVGPPTHFRGYTIGPAFYWILWAIRVTVGPWFDNLPHAGGIGQAILQSAADVLLLAAVWKRTGSLPIALLTVVLLATSAYDLALAPLVWNPVMGSILAKAAIALVLLDWHRGSLVRVAVVAVVAWSAVHSYTGAVYMALAVFAATVAPFVVERRWRAAVQRAAVIAAVVGVLQVPWAVYRMSSRESAPIMGVVTGSLTDVFTGRAAPRVGLSVDGYVGAVGFLQGFPDRMPAAGWILLGAAVIVAIRYRRDPALLAVLLVPQALAIVGYALFQGGLDHYYYLSLMPAAVLTIVLAATALPDRWSFARNVVATVLIPAVLSQVPGRLSYSARLHRMPEYAPLVEGSRRAVRQRQPMRAIETEFALPAPSDATFVYRILGGSIDPASPWIARIRSTGDVDYRKVE
jgi:hypothetical protein